MAVLAVLVQYFPYEQNATLYFLICCIITFMFVSKLRIRSKSINLPPSPPKLPIIGNLHQLGPLLHRSFGELSKKYGPLMLLHMGQIPTLVVTSADLAKEVMKTHDADFANRVQGRAPRILMYECKDIAFSNYTESWRLKRKLCVLQLLSLKRVRSFQFIRDEEIEALMGNIREMFLRSSNSSNEGGCCSVNLSEMISATSNNIICRCIIGQRFETEKSSKFGDLARKMVSQLADLCVGDLFPCLGWVDSVTGKVKKFEENFRALDCFFNEVIEEHKGVKKENDDEKDFVDILLQLQQSHENEFELDEITFKAVLTDMFLGANDTTSTTMEWVMAELARHPSKMKKAQEEIRRVVGTKSKLTENYINEMKYLKCVIKETLRLHPPLVLLLPRQTLVDKKLRGFDIPPKTTIFVNVWAIQRDPKIWEKPDEFIPERFENNEIDFKGQDFEYLPFGSGRRVCPGMTFGLASIDYELANLLYWFDWNLPNGVTPSEMDMSENFGVVVKKALPLYLQPTPYSSCPPLI